MVDFGCILNDTEMIRVVTMTNSSPLKVNYQWSFLQKSPVQWTDPLHDDEGVDVQSVCETDSLEDESLPSVHANLQEEPQIPPTPQRPSSLPMVPSVVIEVVSPGVEDVKPEEQESHAETENEDQPSVGFTEPFSMCSAETAVTGDKDKEIRQKKEETDSVHKVEETNEEDIQKTTQCEVIVSDSNKELPTRRKKSPTKIQQPWQIASQSLTSIGIEQVQKRQ